jgi:hypothetical protein
VAETANWDPTNRGQKFGLVWKIERQSAKQLVVVAPVLLQITGKPVSHYNVASHFLAIEF